MNMNMKFVWLRNKLTSIALYEEIKTIKQVIKIFTSQTLLWEINERHMKGL